MIFSEDEWPGGNNLAWSPAIWEQMFTTIPDENFGLNLDPSHLVWLMIDRERAVYDFADRIFHVHAKDLEVRREGLYRHGSLSSGMGWQVPRLPGSGRWTGLGSLRRSTRSATTAGSRSSTRTGVSRATKSSSSEASCWRGTHSAH